MTRIRSDNSPTDNSKCPTAVGTKLHLLQHMFLIYVFIVCFILFIALLNYAYPSTLGKLLRDEVGLVAFICFVSIQGAFELDDEQSVSQYPNQFYLKAAVYVVDLCLLINSRVQPRIVIFACIFSLAQLAFLYHTICEKYGLSATKNPKEEVQQYHFIGTLIVAINVLALVLVMGKGTIFQYVTAEMVKSLVIGAVVMFYTNVTLNRKIEEFMEYTDPMCEIDVLFRALRMIRPIGNSILGKLRKLKKVKIR